MPHRNDDSWCEAFKGNGVEPRRCSSSARLTRGGVCRGRLLVSRCACRELFSRSETNSPFNFPLPLWTPLANGACTKLPACRCTLPNKNEVASCWPRRPRRLFWTLSQLTHTNMALAVLFVIHSFIQFPATRYCRLRVSAFFFLFFAPGESN